MKGTTLLLLVCALVHISSAQYGNSQAVNVTYRPYDWTTAQTWIWSLVHLPSDYSTSSASTQYPLLVFFHGSGENSANRQLSDLQRLSDTYGPCKEIKSGSTMEFTVGGVLYKFIVVCPQQISGWWGQDGYALHNFLNSIVAMYSKIDQTRIYLTGLSAGGWSTMVYPDANLGYAGRLAAYAPVSADVPPNNMNGTCFPAATRTPMWIIYGAAEAFSRSNNDAVTYYNNCPNRTFTARGSAVPGGDHNALTWNNAYAVDHRFANPNMYEWLLQYARPNLPAASTSTTGSSSTPAPTSPPATAAPTTAPTAAPTCPAAVIGAGSGLRGDYYLGVNFTTIQAIRTDSNISFNWLAAAPLTNGFPADNFSIRWSGTLLAKYTGLHTFTGNADDGIRLFINGNKVFEDWVDHSARDVTGTFAFVAGTSYSIVIEYHEALVNANVFLYWSFGTCLAKEIIPASQLTPAPFHIC